MNIDPLAHMTRALRESRNGEHPNPESTKRIVLHLARAQQKRNGKVLMWLVPIAAVLAFSTAWAAEPSRRAVAALFEHLFRSAPATAPLSSMPPRRAHSIGQPAPAADFDRVPPQKTEPASADSAVIAPLQQLPPTLSGPDRRRRASRAAPTAAPAKPSEPTNETQPNTEIAPRQDEDLRLYQVAHTAHFVRRDAVVALAAWDAYLAARPDGRFSVEARFNRAVCLVRVGRFEDARRALVLFRDGYYGSYRREEAQQLFDALDAL
jgi:hypothetical protein